MNANTASATSGRWNPAVLRAFLEWLLARHAAQGGVTEIRLLASDKGVWSAIVTPEHIDAVVTALQPLSPRPRASIPAGSNPRSGEATVCFTLHPVERGKVLRPGLPFRRVVRAVRDTDVRAWSMLAVDVDPEREPKGRSATDAEKAEALVVAERIRAWLRTLGARPLLADSGNGYHLLVPLVPAYGDEVSVSARKAQRLLRLLHGRFSTPGAKVDRATFNPSRILKLYGTLAIKGESRPDAPHRVSTIDLADIPADFDLFARLAELEAAGELSEAPPPSPAPPARTEPTPAPRDGWRAEALAALPLERVYGELLVGRTAKSGWLACRDPGSPSGDRNPSAGVADGNGDAERGSFHSFLSGETVSVFDFLIRAGKAADFRAACALVAELSGVPLPGAEDVGPALARLAERWPTSSDERSRTELLHATLRVLLATSALVREPALARVQELTALPQAVFRAALAEVRRSQARARRQEAQAGPRRQEGLPVVDFVQNRDSIERLFDAIVTAVLPMRRFFRLDGGVSFVRRGLGPRHVDERTLPGLLSSCVELRFLAQTGDGVAFQRFGVLPADLARAFVYSPGVAARLPELVLYTRSPVFDAGWTFVGTPGFHPATGIWYDGPEIAPMEDSGPLNELLGEFSWRSPIDFVNYLGALVTVATMPHWGRGHAFLAINGNRPGVGKSTLARMLGVIAEGQEPATVTFTPAEEEFEKQLATRIEAGDRIVIIDNVRTNRPIHSAVLERCITDTRLNFRRLGGNTSISRASNDVLFVVTMNLTQLGPDLRRRALPLNLHLPTSTPPHYAMADPIGAALARRAELLSALAGLVAGWLRRGRPMPPRPALHTTNRSWSATVDAILTAAGYPGFLSNFADSERAFDPDYALMVDVCAAHHADPPRTAAEWAKLLVHGVLEERLTDGRGHPKPLRAQATLVGLLFGAYVDGTSFPVGDQAFRLRRHEPRKGHPPEYGFEPVV